MPRVFDVESLIHDERSKFQTTCHKLDSNIVTNNDCESSPASSLDILQCESQTDDTSPRRFANISSAGASMTSADRPSSGQAVSELPFYTLGGALQSDVRSPYVIRPQFYHSSSCCGRMQRNNIGYFTPSSWFPAGHDDPRQVPMPTDRRMSPLSTAADVELWPTPKPANTVNDKWPVTSASSESPSTDTACRASGDCAAVKRMRTAYSGLQLIQLEREFRSSGYLTRLRRIQIAFSLGLSEKQVKIWFQNRRVKDRRDHVIVRGELHGRREPASVGCCRCSSDATF